MTAPNSKAVLVARGFLGLVYFVFGLNGFLQFLPMPPMSGPAGAFLGALVGTGYMFPMIKATEVLGGALLLANRFVPLSLILLAPVTVNIVLFHAVLSPGLGMPLAMVAAQVFLAWAHRDAYAKLFVSTGSAQQTKADRSSQSQELKAAA
jgi:hypothetical protein